METEFARACEEFGCAERLSALGALVRTRPASPSLDARIALEFGWLKPFSELRRGRNVVTGVITGDYYEKYPLYAPWFKQARRDWWNEGAAICNRVPNIPKYSSDPGTALLALPSIEPPGSYSVVLTMKQVWTVHVFREQRLLGACEPGVDSIAKALVMAGIECRLQKLNHVPTKAEVCSSTPASS